MKNNKKLKKPHHGYWQNGYWGAPPKPYQPIANEGIPSMPREFPPYGLGGQTIKRKAVTA